MDGQSFAIGGLIKNNTTTSIKAFPFLGELPVLGALFRSTEFQNDRSELVFVVTPRLVKPLEPGYRLPTDAYQPPTRKELMLQGRSERALPEAAPAAVPPEDGGLELPASNEAR
jgi:pilus assembly protein CpaC